MCLQLHSEHLLLSSPSSTQLWLAEITHFIQENKSQSLFLPTLKCPQRLRHLGGSKIQEIVVVSSEVF